MLSIKAGDSCYGKLLHVDLESKGKTVGGIVYAARDGAADSFLIDREGRNTALRLRSWRCLLPRAETQIRNREIVPGGNFPSVG